MKLSEEAIAQLVNDLEKAKSYEDLMGKDGAIKKDFEIVPRKYVRCRTI